MFDRILHLTDFHFWEVVFNPARLLNKRFIGNLNVILKRRHQFLTGRWKDYAAYAGSLGVGSALLTGDFGSTSTEREFEEGRRFVQELERYGVTPIALAGNHDVYTFESVRNRRFERYFGDWLPVEALPCLIRLPGGTPVVLVPTARANTLSSRGYVSMRDVEEVSRLLATISGPALVVSHYPAIYRTGGYTAPRGRRLLHAESLRAAMGGHGYPVLHMSGHNHRFHICGDDKYGQVTHLITGSLFWHNASAGTEGEFCELSISDGGVEVVRHIHRGGWNRGDVRRISF